VSLCVFRAPLTHEDSADVAQKEEKAEKKDWKTKPTEI
jgi:hypothetical protein